MITDGYLYFKSAIQSSATTSLAIQCEDASNLLAATNPKIRATGELLQLIPAGATGSFVKNIAAACEIKAVVGTTAWTGGEINGFLEYTNLSN